MITEAGEATRFGDGPDRKKLWSVRWKSANLRFAEEGQFGGSMQGLSGTIYDENGTASTFQADQGFADEASGELRLQGNVVVRSPELKATMRSDRLLWASKGREIVQAQGRVRMESEGYRTGEFPELWATPDLSRLATPDAFDKKP